MKKVFWMKMPDHVYPQNMCEIIGRSVGYLSNGGHDVNGARSAM